MRQLTSTEALTSIFDGSNLYAITEKDDQRVGHVIDMHEGYDYTIWRDSALANSTKRARWASNPKPDLPWDWVETRRYETMGFIGG